MPLPQTRDAPQLRLQQRSLTARVAETLRHFAPLGFISFGGERSARGASAGRGGVRMLTDDAQGRACTSCCCGESEGRRGRGALLLLLLRWLTTTHTPHRRRFVDELKWVSSATFNDLLSLGKCVCCSHRRRSSPRRLTSEPVRCPVLARPSWRSALPSCATAPWRVCWPFASGPFPPRSA
jgi:hypothetical protein